MLPKKGDHSTNTCNSLSISKIEPVKTSSTFESTVEKKSFHIDHSFDCDSSRVVYLITCKRCDTQYVESTITGYRKRSNNHKSSMNLYVKGQRGTCGEHLYSHFFEEGHLELEDLKVQIRDVTDKRDPTKRESFWVEKNYSFVPVGQNVRDLSHVNYFCKDI